MRSFSEGHELTRPVAALLARSLAGVLLTVEHSHQATQACDDALRVLAGTLALTDAQTAAPLVEVAASLARELDIPTGAPETAELRRAATLRAARALAAAEGWIEEGGQGVEAALATLEMGSGARYDPAAVQAAARLVRRGELTAVVTPQATAEETDGEGWRAVW